MRVAGVDVVFVGGRVALNIDIEKLLNGRAVVVEGAARHRVAVRVGRLHP